MLCIHELVKCCILEVYGMSMVAILLYLILVSEKTPFEDSFHPVLENQVWRGREIGRVTAKKVNESS